MVVSLWRVGVARAPVMRARNHPRYLVYARLTFSWMTQYVSELSLTQPPWRAAGVRGVRRGSRLSAVARLPFFVRCAGADRARPVPASRAMSMTDPS